VDQHAGAGRARDRGGVVLGAVVDDEQLDGAVAARGQVRGDARERRRQSSFLVVRGD